MTDVFHIEIQEGSDYDTTFYYVDPVTLLPEDLTGYTALLQVKTNYDGYSYPSVKLSFDNSSSDSGLTLGTSAGTIALHIPGSVTTGLLWSQGVYDLVLYDTSNNPTQFIKGFFTIVPGVSNKSLPVVP